MRIASSCTELQGDLVGGASRRARRAPRRARRGRVADGPLEHVHAAHRAADDARPSGRCRARRAKATCAATWSRMVRNGNRGAPLGAVGRERGRTGRALAAAEHVRRDDEPAVGVDRRARADDAGPPARRSGAPGPAAPTTWLSPVRACSTSTALSRAALSVAPGLVGDARRRAARRRARVRARRCATNCRSPTGSPSRQAPVAGGLPSSGARVGLGDERRRHGVFGCLPVHVSASLRRTRG